MKRLTFLLIFVASLGYSQNNLVFNRVLNFILTTAEGVTVPQGKAWKVSGGTNGPFITIENNNAPYGENLVGDGQFGFQNNDDHHIIWLAEGSTIRSTGGDVFLSILEFNVVPISGGNDSGGTGTGGSGNGTTDFNTPGGGQSYGDDFTPSDPLTDNDGNVYQTVTIGPQTWTTSNLNVSTYRDGTPIPHITDYNEWYFATTGAYTYIQQDESLGLGKVYNTWAIIGKHDDDPSTPHKTLAPEGYHIPSKYEWRQIVDYYGGSSQAPEFLMSDYGWANDINGNNSSGLNIYPGAYISIGDPSDCFLVCNQGADLFNQIVFATSTLRSPNNGELVGVYFDQTNVDYDFTIYAKVPGNNYYNSGSYVRLIKD